MKILKHAAKQKRLRYYYGKCSNCGCVVSANSDEIISYGWSRICPPYYYVSCPERGCKNTIGLYSKKKSIK